MLPFNYHANAHLTYFGLFLHFCN